MLKLNRDLVASSIVSKAPQKARKVRTVLAKRLRHKRSKGQARLMVRRQTFQVWIHLGKVLWFKLMREGIGMPQLHDKQSAGAELELRIRTD